MKGLTHTNTQRYPSAGSRLLFRSLRFKCREMKCLQGPAKKKLLWTKNDFSECTFFTARHCSEIFCTYLFQNKTFHVEIWRSQIFRNQKSASNLPMVTTVYRDIDFQTAAEKNASSMKKCFSFTTRIESGVVYWWRHSNKFDNFKNLSTLHLRKLIKIWSLAQNFNVHFNNEWLNILI